MNVGNPKLAAVLAVGAVLAVAFLVYRAIPTESARMARALRQGEGTQADGTPATSVVLIHDPFSHPKLARVDASVRGVDEPREKKPHLESGGLIPDPWLLGHSVLQPLEKANPSAPRPLSPKPANEPHPKNRANISVATKVAHLEATMNMGQEVAMISIDTGPGLAFHVGDHLLNSTITAIDDDGVELKLGNTRSKWAVGKERSF